MEIGPKEIEELTGLIQKTGIGAVAVPFINKVLGPAGDQVGAAIAARLKGFDPKKIAHSFIRAAQMLNSSHLEANEVKAKTLIPLIEAAALEDDETLSEKWAALLANSAVYEGDIIQPAFIEILKQLTSRQATILKHLFKIRNLDGRMLPSIRLVSPLSIASTLSISSSRLNTDSIRIDLENLARLGLCISSAESSHRELNAKTLTASTMTSRTSNEYYAISRFGFAFMLACTPPASNVVK